MKNLQKIQTASESKPDNLFMTCVSFEERCLGSLQRFDNYSSKNVVVFKFEEDNPTREENFIKMERLFSRVGLLENCKTIHVRHDSTVDGIIELHRLWGSLTCPDEITLDISTFTKELLLEVLYYLTNVAKVKSIRFLYTVPDKYASPDEGPLSYGIKKIKTVPFFWNRWSSIKDDLLMVVLGYEEMRAWSLISRFDANINKLFITKPGSKPLWDEHCKIYNKRLLKENYEFCEMPALDPLTCIKILEKQIIDNRLFEKFNIFIAPLGTKPQILGIFYFMLKYPEAFINIVSTTAIEHNTPYYSWGIGESFFINSKDFDPL